MIPKKIGETGWTVQDWDQQWPPVYGKDDDGDTNLEVDKDGDLCVEHSTREGEIVRCYVPLEVLAEVLRRSGYEVVKKP